MDAQVLAKFATPEVIAKVAERMNKSVTSINPVSYRSQVVAGKNYKVKATVRVAQTDISVLIEAYEPLSGPIEINTVTEETVMNHPGPSHPPQVNSDTTNLKYNTDLANRQIQINEWAYNNKMDTLFVFQVLFMSLLFVGLLLMSKNQGYVTEQFVWYSMGVVIFIDIVIVINRSVYTNSRRDTRFWSKKRFQEDNSRDSPLGRGDASYQQYIDSIRSTYGAPNTACVQPTPPTNC